MLATSFTLGGILRMDIGTATATPGKAEGITGELITALAYCQGNCKICATANTIYLCE